MEPLLLPFDAAPSLTETSAGRLGLTHAQDDLLADTALSNARNAKSQNTQRLYRRCWPAFEAWCLGRDVCPMPA